MMSVTRTARVPTEKGSRYMQQLCKSICPWDGRRWWPSPTRWS